MPYHTFMHNKATVATQDMMVIQIDDAPSAACEGLTRDLIRAIVTGHKNDGWQW
jgi:hypothetical protein